MSHTVDKTTQKKSSIISLRIINPCKNMPSAGLIKKVCVVNIGKTAEQKYELHESFLR